MTSRPSVSVIIPCHNYGRFVGQAIESALRQTYEVAEIVIIDDGSTDDSPQVISRYAEAHPTKIKFVQQPNQGLAKTRQAAAEIASSQWVLPLDADDWLHPEAVECYVRRAHERPEAVVVYGGWFITDEDGAVVADYLVHLHRPDEPLEGNILSTVYRGNVVAATSLVKRQSILAVGGYYSPDTSTAGSGHEDYFVYLKMLADGLSFAYVPRALFYYRKVTSSLTHQSGAFRDHQLAVLKSLYRRNFDRMIEAEMAVSLDREIRIDQGFRELRTAGAKLDEISLKHAQLYDQLAAFQAQLNDQFAALRTRLTEKPAALQAAAPGEQASPPPINSEAMRRYLIITSSRSYSLLTKRVFPLIDRLRGLPRLNP